MIATHRIIPLLAACCLQLTSLSAFAEDIFWQPFDTLGTFDHTLADATLADMFGEDPDLWPDWLDPRAVLIPVGRDEALLVIREPYRALCGQYLFTVYGPAGSKGGRDRLGEPFCAGDLSVVPMRGSRLPDLLFSEGHQQDPADSQWKRVDQRVRWTGTEWVRVIQK